ncbi:MAG: restriction endonuclease subunit S [Aestuariivita sp.]|nr:restriction endonuclease subunit S [Aestuariivita sp.]
MSAYPVLRLGDVADVVAGDPAPQDTKAFAVDGPLFVRMQDVGYHHRHPALSESTDRLSGEWVKRNRLRLFPKNSILIPKSGASVNLNHRAKLATDAYVVSHLAVVIPDRTKIEPDYLYWWSASYDPRDQVQATSLPSLKLSTLKAASVPLPPIDEQRRIVGILNRAAKIERLQEQVQEQLRKFMPALFVKMFGDPTENPMGWEVRELGDLCEMDRRGINPNDPIASQLCFVGVEHVEANTGALNFGTGSRVGEQKSVAFHFDNRHVLYGKLRPYLNKVATPDFSGKCSTELIPLLPRKGVDRDFFAELLRRKETVDYVMESVTGSRMPRANMKVLLAMPVPVPPFEVQRRFAKIVETARRIYALETRGAFAANNLISSLMSRLLGECAW